MDHPEEKKRKIESLDVVQGLGIVGNKSPLTLEELQTLLEPFSKEQLISLLSQA